MCIDFDGHHSGGSSFDYVIRHGPYPQVPVGFKKKKIRLRVPVLSLASRKPVRIRQSGRTGIRFVTVSTSPRMSSSSKYMLLTAFYFMDAE